MLPKFGPGADITVSPSSWNKIVDAVDRLDRTALGAGGRGLISPANDVRIKARNDTGSPLVRGAVVDLDDYLLTVSGSVPLDAEHLWFEAVAQAGGAYAAARRQVDSGDFGEFHLSGLCIARVNVLDVNHTRAFPKAGQTYFESSHMGPVRILQFTTPGVEVQECVVLLGVPVYQLRGVAVDTITHSTAGTVNLVKKTSTGYAYMRDGSSNHLTLEAGGYSLQTDQEIATGTAVYLTMFEDGSIEATSGGCAAKDWNLEDED